MFKIVITRQKIFCRLITSGVLVCSQKDVSIVEKDQTQTQTVRGTTRSEKLPGVIIHVKKHSKHTNEYRVQSNDPRKRS